MYATTRPFLDYFNLKNLDELPPLADIRELGKINQELAFEDTDSEQLPQNDGLTALAPESLGEVSERDCDVGEHVVRGALESSVDLDVESLGLPDET
jgi:segregation and condensation protein B